MTAGRIFVGIGSNIEPEENVRRALLLLRERVRLVALATLYLTDPIGRPEQPPFINGVVEIVTETPPWALKYDVLRAIERGLGRQRTADRFAARTVDLDVLLYGDLVTDRPGLRIPDPEILERDFVAVPLCELAPDLVVPGSRRSLCEEIERFSGHSMRPLPALSGALRGELGLC